GPRPARSPLRHQGVHGGAGAVKLLQGTLGGVLRPGAESHVTAPGSLGTVAYFLDRLDFAALVSPPSNQRLWSSSARSPASLLILLHLHATRRPSCHRQAHHPEIPA